MKTTRFLALAAVVTVLGAASASAGEWGHCGKGWGPREGAKEWSYDDYVGDFTKKHGVKFSHGYFYVGKEQKHFVRKWYDWHLETYLYFDPHAHRPYYWCEGHGVWYPISYIAKVGPGAKGPGPVVEKGGPGGGPGPDGGKGPGPDGGKGPGPDGDKGPGPDGGKGAGPGPDGGKSPSDKPGTGEKKPGPGPDGSGGGIVPPEPTNTPPTPDRIAKLQPTGNREVPVGTFEDAIPDTK